MRKLLKKSRNLVKKAAVAAVVLSPALAHADAGTGNAAVDAIIGSGSTINGYVALAAAAGVTIFITIMGVMKAKKGWRAGA